MCSLKLDSTLTITAELISKFKLLVPLGKPMFRLKIADAKLPSHLPGGFEKYQVEMFTYNRDESSINQQLNSFVSLADCSLIESELFEPVYFLIQMFFFSD
jgi:hypothetical protein